MLTARILRFAYMCTYLSKKSKVIK